MFNKPSLFGRDAGGQRRNINQPAGQSVGASSKMDAQGDTVNAGANASRPTVISARTTLDGQKATVKSAADATNQNAASVDDSQRLGIDDDEIGARLIVGPEVKLRGAEILNCDMLVVEGRVEATMDSRVLRITEHGSFSGKVSIDVAEIHGTFDGELTARSQLIIHSTGRVHGKICYGKLVAEEGCELCGDINILSSKSTENKGATGNAGNNASTSASGKEKSLKEASAAPV